MNRLWYLAILLFASAALAQTAPQPSPFAETTMSFNLSQISLPGQQQTLSGMESDAVVNWTEYFHAGETTLISTSPFIGARAEYSFEAISKYLQNHTALTGANYQAGLTGSVGVVKSSVKSYWGERAGIFLRYAPNGSQNFKLGIDLEWNNLPGVDPSQPEYGHHVVSVALGPLFQF